MLFLIILITLQPSIEVLQREGERTILRINPKQEDSVSAGGLIAYSYRMPEVSILDAESVKDDANKNLIEFGSPGKMRDYYVVPFSINVVKGQYVDIAIDAFYEDRLASYAFEPIYRSSIVNYTPKEQSLPGVYLIITPSEFLTEIQPLAEWKRKKGWDVRVATLSETGSDQTSIKNYITNLYASDNLEYVLLVGDINFVPTFSLPNCAVTDHPYSMLEGDDFLPDVMVGRLSASNTGELATIVAKILTYDMTPYIDDTSWYKRALMVGANYPEYVNTALTTKRCIRQRLLDSGFLEVDTVFYPPQESGDPLITSSVNTGVLYVNYRGGLASPNGWDYPRFRIDDVYGLNNGWKLPFVSSLVCYTGSFDAPECFGEAWLRAGTPYQPRGGVAFIGPVSAYTSTRWNNCLDYGIYWGILEENIPTIGQLLLRGKMELLCNFPLEQYGSSGVERYFHDYNLLGDPEMYIWRDVPRIITVEHPTEISVGSNRISIEITDARSASVDGMLVCAYKEDEVSQRGFTNSDGICELDVAPQTSGTMYLTVTKPGVLPYLDSISVGSSETYVAYLSHSIAGDGVINSGETTSVNISLKNYGSVTSNNVSAILRVEDPYVTILDSLADYGSFSIGEVKEETYSFTVSPSCRNSHAIQFSIQSFDGSYLWNSGFVDYVSSPEFSVDSVFIGGDGIIDPGEEGDIYVKIKNIGSEEADNIEVILRNLTSTASVTDSFVYFSELMPGSISTAVFSAMVYPDVAVGKRPSFNVFLNADNGFMDTLFFVIVVGDPDSTIPLGPDEYGYYAYDDLDVGFDSRPTYNWVEIDPEYGGGGTCLYLEDDEINTVSLTFSFKFYGKEYTQLSICANGFLAMGEDICNDMYNWHIPSSMGPSALIAPFWDDFDPARTDSSGDVFCFTDDVNHLFIIEWSRVQHILNYLHETPSELETFQVILLDPEYYITPTGDGEILFQYHTVENNDSVHNYATVGIGDHTCRCGIEYTFAKSYPPEASKVTAGRAIRFTTVPPDTFLGITTECESEFGMNLFPNPSLGNLTIQLTGKDLSGGEIGVYDLSGRSICKIPITKEREYIWRTINRKGEELPEGIYFLRLKAGDKTIIRKFILLR